MPENMNQDIKNTGSTQYQEGFQKQFVQMKDTGEVWESREIERGFVKMLLGFTNQVILNNLQHTPQNNILT